MMAEDKRVRPADVGELVEAIADAVGRKDRLAITGGASKQSVGAPVSGAVTLDMGGFAGNLDYDPAELVLTAGAATPLAQIQALLDERRQMLAFEPFEQGPMLGNTQGSTIGGVVAAAVAGSQRLTHGGARDHLLGFEAVSGRGESFVAGAKVVKNVTGYDLPKLAAGSWGRLFAMTRLTLKVLPAPRARLTRIIEGLSFDDAQRAMASALGSHAEIAAAAFLPSSAECGSSLTLFRLQGFETSVAARSRMLDGLLSGHGTIRDASAEEADLHWSELRSLASLRGQAPLWKISVAPSRAPRVVAALTGAGVQWMADWGGGLIWLRSEASTEAVRTAVDEVGGHATLLDAPAEIKIRVPAFHPQSRGVEALERRLREAFDPAGVFDTGRFREIAR